MSMGLPDVVFVGSCMPQHVGPYPFQNLWKTSMMGSHGLPCLDLLILVGGFPSDKFKRPIRWQSSRVQGLGAMKSPNVCVRGIPDCFYIQAVGSICLCLFDVRHVIFSGGRFSWCLPLIVKGPGSRSREAHQSYGPLMSMGLPWDQ